MDTFWRLPMKDDSASRKMISKIQESLTARQRSNNTVMMETATGGRAIVEWMDRRQRDASADIVVNTRFCMGLKCDERRASACGLQTDCALAYRVYLMMMI
jgi:hypothetical protein